MEVAVEVSLYPLDERFVPPITDFIERLARYEGLRVVTNSMSTQLVGSYDVVMSALTAEMRTSFATGPRAVFVMKVLGALPVVREEVMPRGNLRA